jgi:MoaA/NifB/PqqE/SkfB family radical SAM enzyme
LDVEIIRKVLDDKVITKFSSFIIAGGEPILHPRFKEVMSLFRGRQYLFLSNGLLVDRLVEAVRQFRIKRLSLSLDGTPETYKEVRGVDGYSKVEKVVQELRKDEVSIYIFFVVNPWNTRKDLKHVIEFCRKYGVHLLAGYYQNFPYYNTTLPAEHLYDVNDLLSRPSFSSNPHPYFKLYDQWASGDLNIPCFSVLLRPVIRTNGDVELCEGRESKIGNLYKQRLGEIWASKKTRDLQRQFFRCNACWADGQRPMDIVICSILRSFFPPALLDRVLGKYDWEKVPPIWSM